MMYRTRSLTTWEAFEIRPTSVKNLTIWVAPELWYMMPHLSMVALFVALLTLLIVPDPTTLKVAKFTEISKFLNVVVGLLLGFLLSSSMNSWYTCVNGFLELLDAIRNLQMQFVALGVPKEWSILCLRYAFVSAWLLYSQLQIEIKRLSVEDPGTLEPERDEMWNHLCEKIAHIDHTNETMLLKESEAAVLRLTRDPPGMMWMFICKSRHEPI